MTNADPLMIEKLEMFIALAKEKHFGRAAEECHVTQPTLSAAIKQLEEQLGVMLVRRGSRFLGLTPEGQRVLEWARRIVSDTRAMREEIRAAKHGLAGHVTLAAIPTALAMVSELTTPFSAQHPNVTFSILSRSSVEILSLLENLEIDVGITYLDNEPLGPATTVPLYLESYWLVISEEAKYASRKSVSWKTVSQLPLCLLTPDMQNRRIINQHLMEAGAVANPTLRIGFDDRVVCACPHRPMGQHYAAGARRDIRSLAKYQGDSDRRARSHPSRRPGRRAQRASHADYFDIAAAGESHFPCYESGSIDFIDRATGNLY